MSSRQQEDRQQPLPQYASLLAHLAPSAEGQQHSQQQGQQHRQQGDSAPADLGSDGSAMALLQATILNALSGATEGDGAASDNAAASIVAMLTALQNQAGSPNVADRGQIQQEDARGGPAQHLFQQQQHHQQQQQQQQPPHQRQQQQQRGRSAADRQPQSGAYGRTGAASGNAAEQDLQPIAYGRYGAANGRGSGSLGPIPALDVHSVRRGPSSAADRDQVAYGREGMEGVSGQGTGGVGSAGLAGGAARGARGGAGSYAPSAGAARAGSYSNMGRSSADGSGDMDEDGRMPGRGGLSAGGVTGDRGGVTSDGGVDMSAIHAGIITAREKNRQAQRRFRERQRGLIAELKDQMTGLEQQVQDQAREIAILREENTILLARLEAHGIIPQQRMGQQQQPHHYHQQQQPEHQHQHQHQHQRYQQHEEQ